MNAPAPAGDGMMHRVQYFERYRIEYHPEMRTRRYQVLLGLLGVSQADKDGIGQDDPNRVPEMAGVSRAAACRARSGGTCGGSGCSHRALTNLHVGDGGDGYGFNVDGIGLDGPSKDAVLGKVQEAKFGWVRQQVRWSSVETSKGQFGNELHCVQLDAFVNAANAKGLNILLSPDQFTGVDGISRRLTALVACPRTRRISRISSAFSRIAIRARLPLTRCGTRKTTRVETGGTVNVAAYLPILKAGYTVLKAKDPNITVVFGGMTPTGVTGHPEIALDETQYLQQFYPLNGGEGKKYYDVLGAHPGSNCNPPDNSYPDNPADE